MRSIRQVLQHQIHALVGFGTGAVDLDQPLGDPGLFGPASMAWRVHGDFTAMMVGGVSALLLQMLHPGALAGVWDHSNFRADMLGRLRRTAQFISATTYGPTGEALRLIERVRGIHDQVHGRLPDGTPYSANDPALLTWIHVAETHSFLSAYLRYREPGFPPADQDRYYSEVATIAERLGATDVPRSRAAVAAYLRAVRPTLRADERSAAVADALLSQPAPSLLTGPFRPIFLTAGIELLPDWAAAMHGRSLGPARRLAVRTAAVGLGTMLRHTLTDGSASRARRRVAGL